jgi:hypothetical protein
VIAAFEQEIKLCVLAGYSVRNLSPVDAYELAARITRDKALSVLADSLRVPASQGAKDRVGVILATPHHERVAMFAASADMSEQFSKDCHELANAHSANYEGALASMSKAELAALRARVDR